MPYVKARVEQRILVIETDNPPVNALGASVRRALCAAIDYGVHRSEVVGIVLHCAGRTFFAGADIKEFGKPAEQPDLQTVVSHIENCPKPVVAAIHGTAFGGGLEVALAAHQRVATPSARLGLPEVKLGLLPGAGGTQRLPRLIAVEEALTMIVSGEPVTARAGAAMGLVDLVTDEHDLLAEAKARARRMADSGEMLPTSRRPVKIMAGTNVEQIFQSFRFDNPGIMRNLEAPEACVQAVEAACRLPFEEGCAAERALFVKLLQGGQSGALCHLFFAERSAGKIEPLPKDWSVPPVTAIGVIGAGTMGRGIATAFLQSGYPVRLVERDAVALERGVAAIEMTLETAVRKGRMTQEAAFQARAYLQPSLAFEDLGDCDLVVEAVYEEMSVKREILRVLEQVTMPSAILATNTSYLDIDEMAAGLQHPERLVGLHFFSPANIMKLVEVVRGRATSPASLSACVPLVRKLRKIPVVTGVCDGFIGNRMLKVRQREAEKLVLEGALPWDVDRVLTDFGFPMGPFQMADLAGLDLGWNADTSKGATLKEILCEQGRRGQKTLKGFYDYGADRSRSRSTEVEALIAAFAKRAGTEQLHVEDQEILERLLFPMINEAGFILDEGIAARASDIDVVWVHGYGWPRWTGGPLFWAGTFGLDRIGAGLAERARIAGSTLRLSPLLEAAPVASAVADT